MAIAARAAAPRKHLVQVRLEKRAREALEGRTDRAARVGIACEKAFLERAVAREQIARRHAEGHEVARPVEAIEEAGEDGGVARRIELADKGCRRRSHHGERALERAAEQIDAAVGQARREQRDDLAIGGVGVAERVLDRVAAEARGVVEVPIEPLERLSQRGG